MQKHTLLWIILIAVCILALPALSTPTDIMNRVMSGSVIVMGLFALIWLTNSGITEPREAITLP